MSDKQIGRRAYLGTFLTSVSIQCFTVLQGILTARMLGVSGRGEFAAVILWPSIFAGVGIVGVNMAIARRAGNPTDYEYKSLIRTAVVVAGVTGFVTAVVCAIALPLLIPQTLRHIMPAAYLFLLFIPLNHVAMNLQGLDQGSGNFWLLNVTRVLLNPVFLFGLLLCWFFASDKVFWVTAALLIANGVTVAVRLYIKTKDLSHAGATLKTLDAGGIMRESVPFFGASVLAILYQQCDKALLVWFLPAKEIGLYVVAFSAASVLSSLNQSVGAITFTKATWREPGTGFPVLAQALRRGAILTVIGAVILSFTLPFLLPFVYGAPFYKAVSLALLLLPCIIISGVGDILNQDMRGQGKPIAGVISKIVGLIVIVAVGLCLTSRMGAAGIAVGVLAGETVSFGGLLLVAMKFYKDAGVSHLMPAMEDIIFFRREIAYLKARIR